MARDLGHTGKYGLPTSNVLDYYHAGRSPSTVRRDRQAKEEHAYWLKKRAP